jgi:hypothetical protein
VSGLDCPFEISEPPTEIEILLWDPSPNARMWRTISERLATGDLLTVTFSYDYLSLGDARPLWRFLAGATDYVMQVVEGDVPGYWSVEGHMQKPMYVTLEFLDRWVKWMASAGVQHSARYFAWTVARTSPPHQH